MPEMCHRDGMLQDASVIPPFLGHPLSFEDSLKLLRSKDLPRAGLSFGLVYLSMNNPRAACKILLPPYRIQ